MVSKTSCGITNFPFMVVQTDASIAKNLLSNGVKCATDGLAKRGEPFSMGALQRTKAALVHGGAIVKSEVVVAGEDAILSPHDAGDEVAVAVGIGHALAVDDGLCRGMQMGPHGVEAILDGHHLVERHGCARVALDATSAVACREVATKLFGENI